jgi:hypothetical protein
MANYTVIVTISERYEFEDVLNKDEAIQIAEDCVSDNLPDLSRDAIITYNAIRTDIPLFGDATDAGIAGE